MAKKISYQIIQPKHLEIAGSVSNCKQMKLHTLQSTGNDAVQMCNASKLILENSVIVLAELAIIGRYVFEAMKYSSDLGQCFEWNGHKLSSS